MNAEQLKMRAEIKNSKNHIELMNLWPEIYKVSVMDSEEARMLEFEIKTQGEEISRHQRERAEKNVVGSKVFQDLLTDVKLLTQAAPEIKAFTQRVTEAIEQGKVAQNRQDTEMRLLSQKLDNHLARFDEFLELYKLDKVKIDESHDKLGQYKFGFAVVKWIGSMAAGSVVTLGIIYGLYEKIIPHHL